MFRAAAAAVMALFVLALAEPASAQKAVFVVRHAERADQTSNSPLSAEGRSRAESLARLLKDAGVSGIFVSQFQRTAQTAQPLASMLGVTPTVVPAAGTSVLVEEIRAVDAGKSAVVVGHSDTVPAILKALGCVEEVTVNTDEFDRLFIVIPGAGPKPVLLELHY